MFETPILFLIFTRLDTSLRVFEAIRQARPRRLFIAADGPRPDKVAEAENCALVRSRILAAIDWECEVKTLFRDENRGCRSGIQEAISWFFEQVDEGIILEDDCLPAPDFFDYCRLMLERYRHESRIAMISGTSLLLGKAAVDASYFLSRHFNIWGWATWKDRWFSLRANELKEWENKRGDGWLWSLFHNRHIVRFYTSVFDKDVEGRLDTWDSYWNYSLLFHDKLTVTPVKNLISNIGVSGMHAAHGDDRFYNLPLESFHDSPPPVMAQNEILDRIQFSNVGLSAFSWKIVLRNWSKRIGLLNWALYLKQRLKL